MAHEPTNYMQKTDVAFGSVKGLKPVLFLMVSRGLFHFKTNLLAI